MQRAIQRLTDPENPTSADRMLIVTFTKAAAAEMRARLEARLHQMLRENPGDPHLRRQSVLLAQAHIGTVDSFCAEMVREFFHLLDLSPDFKIISDKQEENLVDAALNEALSQAFEEGAVGALADAFAGERDDRPFALSSLPFQWEGEFYLSLEDLCALLELTARREEGLISLVPRSAPSALLPEELPPIQPLPC